MTGSPTQGIKTVLHPVSDLEKAKAVYTALLGVPPQTDSSYYVGFEAAGQQIGLVPRGGPQGMTSPVAYWHVPDIEAKLAEVTAAGATLKEPAHDVGGGRLVATVSASADGAPYLVPLSFDWDGEALLLATPTDSPTGRNLAATRAVRLGLGLTRDVSMIEGEVEVLEIDALPQERGDRFVAHTGFDPRALATPYRWFRISPRRIQAWREVNELPDRELMRDGRWLI
jgi:predicted enzyme related to lactoylglutathione lyase